VAIIQCIGVDRGGAGEVAVAAAAADWLRGAELACSFQWEATVRATVQRGVTCIIRLFRNALEVRRSGCGGGAVRCPPARTREREVSPEPVFLGYIDYQVVGG